MQTIRRPARSWPPRLALLVLLLTPAATRAATRTTTTTIHYNADGAPSAVVTRVGSEPSTTTYLTWDNFTPNAATPTTGTVRTANGNLVGVGATPDRSGQYAYDARNRLMTCSPPGRQAASYAYHAASLMQSSTLESGDALQFYYDTAGTPRMINTRQPSSGASASFLGPVRYLSDGSEQILFSPRKDVAGLYDAAAQSLAPYHYDPYGVSTDPVTPTRPHVSTSALGPSQYDLSANPFQYAGEYRDPTCDAYYLRARWYLPVQHTFLSRDPADALHRFSYTAGNPIGRTDPSGFRFTGAGVSRGVGNVMHALMPGRALPWIEPALPVWGQVLGGIQLVGLLPSFFHHPTSAGYVDFGFLTASIVAEGVGHGSALDRLFLRSSASAFGTRLGIDASLGASQSIGQSYRHGRWDTAALGQGIETAAAGIFWSRLAGGIGYRPYSMTAADVDEIVAAFRNSGSAGDDLLVFRLREDLSVDNVLPGETTGRSRTTPLREWTYTGQYHESFVAFGASRIRSEMSAFAELAGSRNDNSLGLMATGASGSNDLIPVFFRAFDGSSTAYDAQQATADLSPEDAGAMFRFVGRARSAMAADDLAELNPRNFAWRPTQVAGRGALDDNYHPLFNNCHHHVAAVIGQLEFR